jgi:hypothetical protein
LDLQDNEYMMFLSEMDKLLIDSPHASVRDVYLTIDPRFYKLLELVHGMPKGVVMDMHGKIVNIPEGALGGHRLRVIFPAIRLGPSEALLSQTLAHFILLRRLKAFEAEVERDLKSDLPEEAIATKLRALMEFRASVAQSEREVDAGYQAIRFRAANDNEGVGAAVLGDSPRPWREVVRR